MDDSWNNMYYMNRYRTLIYCIFLYVYLTNEWWTIWLSSYVIIICFIVCVEWQMGVVSSSMCMCMCMCLRRKDKKRQQTPFSILQQKEIPFHNRTRKNRHIRITDLHRQAKWLNNFSIMSMAGFVQIVKKLNDKITHCID